MMNSTKHLTSCAGMPCVRRHHVRACPPELSTATTAVTCREQHPSLLLTGRTEATAKKNNHLPPRIG